MPASYLILSDNPYPGRCSVDSGHDCRAFLRYAQRPSQLLPSCINKTLFHLRFLSLRARSYLKSIGIRASMSLWPPRFTSLTSGSSGNANRAPPASPPRVSRDQHPPPAPRPAQSSSPRQQPHTRAVSHPLPRIFGKKKSAPVLRSVPLDEHLVPVLDAGPSGGPTLDKPIGGRKKDEELITRQCMCCDNKVRFPRDLHVFRCTNCLTINDLEPYVKQARDPKSSTYPGQQQGPQRESIVS